MTKLAWKSQHMPHIEYIHDLNKKKKKNAQRPQPTTARIDNDDGNRRTFKSSAKSVPPCKRM